MIWNRRPRGPDTDDSAEHSSEEFIERKDELSETKNTKRGKKHRKKVEDTGVDWENEIAKRVEENTRAEQIRDDANHPIFTEAMTTRFMELQRQGAIVDTHKKKREAQRAERRARREERRLKKERQATALEQTVGEETPLVPTESSSNRTTSKSVPLELPDEELAPKNPHDNLCRLRKRMVERQTQAEAEQSKAQERARRAEARRLRHEERERRSEVRRIQDQERRAERRAAEVRQRAERAAAEAQRLEDINRNTELALQLVREAERERQRHISPQAQYHDRIQPPPKDEYSQIDEDIPPYHASLHKYLDLISYDERFAPCLRVNRYLVHGESELTEAIHKFSQFNLLPTRTNLWAISHVDDRDYERMIPILIPQQSYHPIADTRSLVS